MAGGMVNGYTMSRAKELGIDVAAERRNHNSYDVLRKLGDTIFTGVQGTNVQDLRVIPYLGVDIETVPYEECFLFLNLMRCSSVSRENETSAFNQIRLRLSMLEVLMKRLLESLRGRSGVLVDYQRSLTIYSRPKDLSVSFAGFPVL